MDVALNPDYVRQQQLMAARIKLVAKQRAALDVARVYAAYRHLDANVDWNIVLDYWIERIMLRHHDTEQATGQHNFLVMVLEDMAKAQSLPTTLPLGDAL